MEFVVDSVAFGQVFLHPFWFPMSVIILPLLLHTHLSSWSVIIPPVLHDHVSSWTGTVGMYEATTLTSDGFFVTSSSQMDMHSRRGAMMLHAACLTSVRTKN